MKKSLVASILIAAASLCVSAREQPREFTATNDVGEFLIYIYGPTCNVLFTPLDKEKPKVKGKCAFADFGETFMYVMEVDGEIRTTAFKNLKEIKSI